MGMFWTDNNARRRAIRLWRKIGSSPFLPLLTWGKVAESLFTAVPFTPSVVAALIATLWFVLAEDLQEYMSQKAHELEEEVKDE